MNETLISNKDILGSLFLNVLLIYIRNYSMFTLDCNGISRIISHFKSINTIK